MLSPAAEPRVVFTHCPRCGRPSLGPHATYGFVCSHCSFLFFLNVAAAAAAIIRDEEGRVLLARRAHEPGAGLLDVPGGFIDYGETAEEAVRRELREELSLEIDGFVFVDLAQFDQGRLAFDSVRRALALLGATPRPGPAAPTDASGH